MVIWDGDYDAYWNSGVSRDHSHHIFDSFFVILIYLYLILSYIFSSVLPWNK